MLPLLRMSSCSTWKHHLAGLKSCCSESTNSVCEGHEQGHLHVHTNCHTMRLQIEKFIGVAVNWFDLYGLHECKDNY